MIQPMIYMTPDANVHGLIALPEYPLALEPRICTRIEIQKYAREAYEAGTRGFLIFASLSDLMNKVQLQDFDGIFMVYCHKLSFTLNVEALSLYRSLNFVWYW